MSRPRYGWMEQVCLLKHLPEEIGKALPRVRSLAERLPTIGTQELAAELEWLIRTLVSYRDLTYFDHVWTPLPDEEPSDPAPALRGRLRWRVAA